MKKTILTLAAILVAAAVVADSVQCLGTTKKGARCRNKTANASGYCYLHVGQDPRGTNTAAVVKR